MGGHADPEARIYCEDAVAEHIIGAALSADLRRRTTIVPIGSESELVAQALFHQRSEIGELQALIWDGDVSAEAVRSSVREGVRRQPRQLDAGRVSWTRLPGQDGPEKWLISILSSPGGHQCLANELRIETHEAAAVLGELEAVGDGHEITYRLAERMRLRPDEALSKLVAAVQKMEEEPLAPLGEFVRQVLDGRVVHDPEV